MADLVHIRNLSVGYGGRTVLRIDNLRVDEGQVVGIIGGNGAGKSTFVKCLLGDAPYKGTVDRSFSMRDVGVLMQDNKYSGLMRVGELASIVARRPVKDVRLASWLSEFELEGLLNRRISALSGGERQRMTLAMVLWLNPSVVFLDEMTTGLDYENRLKLLRTVQRRTVGKTVFDVTHYFEELEGWADRILVFRDGIPLFWGSVAELERLNPHYSVIQTEQQTQAERRHRCFVDKTGSRFLVADDGSEEAAIDRELTAERVAHSVKRRNIYSSYVLLTGTEQKQ